MPAQGTINFSLPQAPTGGATASIYLGCASDHGGGVEVDVNGTNLSTVPWVMATPSPLTATGFSPTYQDDTDIHCATSGPFSDERILFPGNLLHAGLNTVTIKSNALGYSAFLMTDYVHLELSGYVAPPPGAVPAYAGNNRVLVTWPAVPGAIGYTLLRSTTPTGNYGRVAGEIGGRACGDSGDTVTYTDTTANGTTYYYEVQTESGGTHSPNSAPSAGVTPSASASTGVPAAPTGLTVTQSSHQTVSLSWNASPGAGYYTVWRATLHSDNNNGLYPLRTIPLGTPTTGTSYTDNTPTDGTTVRLLCGGDERGGVERPLGDGEHDAAAGAAGHGPGEPDGDGDHEQLQRLADRAELDAGSGGDGVRDLPLDDFGGVQLPEQL